MKINTKLIRNRMWSKYMPYIKPDNTRITTSVISMASCDLGVSEKTVYNLFIGRCSLGLLKRVVSTYDISPEEIFIKED